MLPTPATKEDIWAMARQAWESSSMSWRELAEHLSGIFGDRTPTFSALSKRARKENWIRLSTITAGKATKNSGSAAETPKNVYENQDTGNTGNTGNNKERNSRHTGILETLAGQNQQYSDDGNGQDTDDGINGAYVPIETTLSDIIKSSKKLSLTKEQLEAIIQQHRLIAAVNGDIILNNSLEILKLQRVNVADNPEHIQKMLVYTDSISRTITNMSIAHNSVLTTMFKLSGINIDDIGVKDDEAEISADFRKLEERFEQEVALGEKRKQELIERWREIESFTLDDDAASRPNISEVLDTMADYDDIDDDSDQYIDPQELRDRKLAADDYYYDDNDIDDDIDDLDDIDDDY